VQGLDFDGDRYLFGHLAEGNFHVNVVGSSDPARVADLVLGLVVELDGAIASEHGIGTEKSAWWRQVTEPALLAQTRKLKDALDPSGILNPSVFWG
jgi:FAD/FMN-containing dehydrogenase